MRPIADGTSGAINLPPAEEPSRRLLPYFTVQLFGKSPLETATKGVFFADSAHLLDQGHHMLFHGSNGILVVGGMFS